MTFKLHFKRARELSKEVFDGDESRWKTTTLMQAFLVPGLFFGIFFLLNLCIWGEKSSGAVPFTTLFAILVLWCLGDAVQGRHLGRFHRFFHCFLMVFHHVRRTFHAFGAISVVRTTAEVRGFGAPGLLRGLHRLPEGADGAAGEDEPGVPSAKRAFFMAFACTSHQLVYIYILFNIRFNIL